MGDIARKWFRQNGYVHKATSPIQRMNDPISVCVEVDGGPAQEAKIYRSRTTGGEVIQSVVIIDGTDVTGNATIVDDSNCCA